MERVRINDFYVGRWLVQPSLNQIADGAHTVRIPPKYIGVLVVLAEHPGEVVTRHHLLDTIWADTVVVESVLTRAIFELRKVFDDDAQHPQVIETILKTGYRLIAPVAPVGHHPLSTSLLLSDGASDGMATPALPTVSESTPDSPDALYLTPSLPPFVDTSPRSVWPLLGLATMGLVLFALSGWFWLRPTTPPADASAPRYTLTPATTFQGQEVNPALSPNGQHLAFSWDGGTPGAWDLYVKPIDDEQVLRLTDHPASEFRATWSPDGQRIAFVRWDGQSCEVYVVSIFGGAARKLTACDGQSVYEMAWSPDGASLLFSSSEGPGRPHRLFLLSMETLEKRQLTTPPSQTRGDLYVAFSPDGQTIAFSRAVGAGNDLHLLPTTGGEPTRLTFDDTMIFGLAWMPDGETLLYGSDRANRWTLWTLNIADPQPIWAGITLEGGFYGFSSSADGRRIVYATASGDRDIWQLPLTGQGEPSPFIASSRWDARPQVSPDGEKIVFYSWRSGEPALWISDRDGANPFRLLTLVAPLIGTPQWSPDGAQIVYSDVADLYVMDAGGAQPRRLTNDAGRDLAPMWSPDGQWIYFSSNRSGTLQVWRMAADGRDLEQRTHQQANTLLMRVTEQDVYFVGDDAQKVWKIPIGGGTATVAYALPEPYLLESWAFAKFLSFQYPLQNWVATDDGLYFVNHDETGSVIRFFQPETGRVTHVASFPTLVSGMTVSPDGAWLLYGQGKPDESDIMLLDNLR